MLCRKHNHMLLNNSINVFDVCWELSRDRKIIKSSSEAIKMEKIEIKDPLFGEI